MDTIECIATRRSIRKYMDVDVPQELIGTIIDSGRYAPSSGNIQNWRFVIVRDPEIKKQIANSCMQQLWIANAPVIIVLLSETEKIKQFFANRGVRHYAIQNCAAAVENMMLAAHALGLASCWVGAYDETLLKRALNVVPDDVKPQAVLPIGYPDEVVPTPMHYTLENVCYLEQYGSGGNATKIKDYDRLFQKKNYFGRIEKNVKGAAKTGSKMVNRIKKDLSKK